MVYIENGTPLRQRSPWRLSIIKDFFEEVVGFSILFVTTFLPDTNPDEAIEKHKRGTRLLRTYGSGSGSRNGGGNNFIGRRGPTGSNIRGMGSVQTQAQRQGGGGG